MFLKGINLIHTEGQACPTRECRFYEYEDLPLYNPVIDPPAFEQSVIPLSDG